MRRWNLREHCPSAGRELCGTFRVILSNNSSGKRSRRCFIRLEFVLNMTSILDCPQFLLSGEQFLSGKLH